MNRNFGGHAALQNIGIPRVQSIRSILNTLVTQCDQRKDKNSVELQLVLMKQGKDEQLSPTLEGRK